MLLIPDAVVRWRTSFMDTIRTSSKRSIWAGEYTARASVRRACDNGQFNTALDTAIAYLTFCPPLRGGNQDL